MRVSGNVKQNSKKGKGTNSKKSKKIFIKPPQKKVIKNAGALKKAKKSPVKNDVRIIKDTVKKQQKITDFINNKSPVSKNGKKRSPKLQKIQNTSNCEVEKKISPEQMSSEIKIEIETDQDKENFKKAEKSKKTAGQLKRKNGVKAKDEKKYNCKYCDFVTPYLSSYKIHTDIHEGVKYECQACLHKAASKGALLAHMRRSPLCKPHLDPKKQVKKSRGPPKEHRCDKCSFSAQTKKVLNDHKILHLPKDQLPQFRCEFCSFVAIRKNNMMRHRRLLHAENMGVKMETLYCYHCDYTTIYKTNLIDHIKRHFKERKIYACQYCDLTFIYKMAYLQHETTHLTEGLRYECPARNCDYKVPKKYMLKKHMIKHQSEHQVKMYQCPNCSHRTKYRASFRKHLEHMCFISWEQWKEEYDQKKVKKVKEKDGENAKEEEEVVKESSESEAEWEFSLSDQEI